MMTETELQLTMYAEGILRARGYADVADTVANIGRAARAARFDLAPAEPGAAKRPEPDRPAPVPADQGPSDRPTHGQATSERTEPAL